MDLHERRGSTEDHRDRQVKLEFRLEQNADGYPPSSWEHVWADMQPDGHLKVDNVPFYAPGVSFGDIVEAREEDGMLRFQRVIERSGRSTLRVILYSPEDCESLRDRLHALGTETEVGHIPGLVAVDVPCDGDINAIVEYLRAGRDADRWDFETGHVAAEHARDLDI